MKQLPLIKTCIPGPISKQLIAELAEYECPAITARTLTRANLGGTECPIVWEKTHDIFVEDVDGNRFIDLTSGFGVAGVGHANPNIVHAGQEQLAKMPHAMGDAFPANNKIALAKRLAEITPGNLKRSLFASAGFEAVEAALKTAMIKTGKPTIIAFEDAYHGLGYGALAVSSYREKFRQPFLSQLNPHILRLPYPKDLSSLAGLLKEVVQKHEVGALIIEPILGRGGIIEAPSQCLQYLREFTQEHNIVMIVDEIYTGFGRTGTWFAIENAKIVPDILCLGKGLSGGFPISAAIGTDEVMSGWGDAEGEAIHTSTFLGNPTGCAMALACIEVLEKGLLKTVNQTGDYFKKQLEVIKKNHSIVKSIRGRGLMLGIEFDEKNPYFVLQLSKKLLQKGLIALPCGLKGNVLSLTPPFTIKSIHIDFFLSTLSQLLKNHAT